MENQNSPATAKYKELYEAVFKNEKFTSATPDIQKKMADKFFNDATTGYLNKEYGITDQKELDKYRKQFMSEALPKAEKKKPLDSPFGKVRNLKEDFPEVDIPEGQQPSEQPKKKDDFFSSTYGFDVSTNPSESTSTSIDPRQDKFDEFDRRRNMSATERQLENAFREPSADKAEADQRRLWDAQEERSIALDKDVKITEDEGLTWREDTTPILPAKYDVQLPDDVKNLQGLTTEANKYDTDSSIDWLSRNVDMGPIGRKDRAMYEKAESMKKKISADATNSYKKYQSQYEVIAQEQQNALASVSQMEEAIKSSNGNDLQKREALAQLKAQSDPELARIEKQRQTTLESLYELNTIIGDANNDTQGSVETDTKEFYNNSVGNIPRLAGSFVGAVDQLAKAPKKWVWDSILNSSNIDSPTLKAVAVWQKAQLEQSDIAVESLYDALAGASQYISTKVDQRPERSVARQTGTALGQLAQMTAGSVLGGPAVGMLAGAALSADEMMQSGIQSGLKYKDAALMAGYYAPFGTVLEYYGASRGIATLEKASLRKFIIDKALKGEVEELSQKGVTKWLKEYVKETGTQGLEEYLTEGSQFMLQDLMQRGYNASNTSGPKYNNPDFFGDQYKKIFSENAEGGAYAAFVMQTVTQLMGVRKRNFHHFVNSVQTDKGFSRIKSSVELDMKQNGIEQSVIDDALVQLDFARGLAGSIPKGYSESDQIQWFNSNMKKADIERKRENIAPAIRKVALKTQEENEDAILEELDQKNNPLAETSEGETKTETKSEKPSESDEGLKAGDTVDLEVNQEPIKEEKPGTTKDKEAVSESETNKPETPISKKETTDPLPEEKDFDASVLESDSKSEVTKPLTKDQEKSNTVVQLFREHNNLPKNKRGKNASKLMGAMKAASELGYVIKQLPDGKYQVLSSKGKRVNSVSEKTKAAKPTQAQTDFAVKEITKGLLNWNGDMYNFRPELDLSWAEIRAGQRDIENGKTDTEMAHRLINAIAEGVNSEGYFTFVAGSGAMIQRSGVPFATLQENISKKEQAYLAEHEAEYVQQYDEWFDNLSDEEKVTHLKDNNDVKENREATENQIESDQQGESGVRLQDGESQEKQVKEKADQKIDDFFNWTKDILGNDLDPNTKIQKQGVDQDAILDKMAEVVKALVRKGIDLQEAIKTVMEKAKDVLGTITEKDLRDRLKQGEKKQDKEPPAEPPKEKTKEPKSKKPEKKKKSYIQRLKAFAKGDVEAEEAVKSLGEKYYVQKWAKAEPKAQGVLDAALASENPIQALRDIMHHIGETTNNQYTKYPELSTIHSILYHKVISHLYEIRQIDEAIKWADSYDRIGRKNGQFIAAMQEIATPEAIANKVRGVLEKDKNEAMTPERLKEIEEVQKLLKLSEQENEELKQKLDEALNKAKKPPTEPKVKVAPINPQGNVSKEKQKAARAKLKEGLSDLRKAVNKTRGQANLGVPLNADMASAVKKIIESVIELGYWKAVDIKNQVHKQIKEALGKKEADEMLSDENWNKVFGKEEIAAAEDNMKESFIEKVENRFKSNLSKGKKKVKDPMQLLLETLIQKVDQTTPKNKTKTDNTFAKIKAAIENGEIGDEVWAEAVENVKSWLETNNEYTDDQKAQIINDMENSVSMFMKNPLPAGLISKAIRTGEKTLDEAIADIVKKHPIEQGEYLQTLSEKLIQLTGIDPKYAQQIEDIYTEEVSKYMEETKLKELRKKFGLDENGQPLEKKDAKNKYVYESIVEAINLGALDNRAFQDHFAEKYGFSPLSQKDIGFIKRMIDLIFTHGDSEMGRKYRQDLMNYIEHIKPNTTAKIVRTLQAMAITGMLSGEGTVATNITFGSIAAYITNMASKFIANPISFTAGAYNYFKTGFGGTGFKSFVSIMQTGFNPLDESGDKFNDFNNETGSEHKYKQNEKPSEVFKKLKDAFKNKKTIPGALVGLAVSAHAKITKISNYAAAFDAIMNHSGIEIIEYMDNFKKESDKLSSSGRKKTLKEVFKKVNERMGYDRKAEVEEDVDALIAQMKSRGEKIYPGFRQRAIKDKMIERRDQDAHKNAVETLRLFTLMNTPEGVTGYGYEWLSQQLRPNEKNPAIIAYPKLAAQIANFVFFRIAVASLNRSIENIPLIGLGLPGVFYEVLTKKVDPSTGKKEWKGGFQLNSSAKIKQKLIVHAVVTAATWALAANLFKYDDDEDKWKLDPDRSWDVLGPGANYWENEQLSTKNTEGIISKFMPYTVIHKNSSGVWKPVTPARLLPQALPAIALVGGIRDEIMYGGFPDKKQQKELIQYEKAVKQNIEDGTEIPERFNDIRGEKQDPVLVSFLINKLFSLDYIDNIMGATSEQNFNTPMQNLKKMVRAEGFENKIEQGREIIARPAKTIVYPNIVRDMKNEYSAIKGDAKTTSNPTPFKSLINGDVDLYQMMSSREKTDVFGIPVIQQSPIVNTIGESPIATFFFPDFRANNQDRFEDPAWQIKLDHPTVLVKEYYDRRKPWEERMTLKDYTAKSLHKLVLDKIEADKNPDDAKITGMGRLKDMDDREYKITMDILFEQAKRMAKKQYADETSTTKGEKK